MNGYDPHTLLDLIGEVVREADSELPEAVTQAAFDRTAGEHERFARVPPARSLSRFYLQSWRDLVELSLRDPRSRAKTLAMRVRTEQALWLSDDAARNALRVVCRRLGGVVPSREAYRRERARLINGAGRDAVLVEEMMPTENQIEALLGDWAVALAEAGLGQVEHSVPPVRRDPNGPTMASTLAPPDRRAAGSAAIDRGAPWAVGRPLSQGPASRAQSDREGLQRLGLRDRGRAGTERVRRRRRVHSHDRGGA